MRTNARMAAVAKPTVSLVERERSIEPRAAAWHLEDASLA
jgi:hypothetical protein